MACACARQSATTFLRIVPLYLFDLSIILSEQPVRNIQRANVI